MSCILPFYWVTPQSVFHAFLYVMLGVLAGIGHFVLIKAFDHAPASLLAPFIYVQVVAVLLLGYLVFDSFPDAWSLTGMAIIAVVWPPAALGTSPRSKRTTSSSATAGVA